MGPDGVRPGDPVLGSGLVLTLLGMGVVFAFLGLLVLVVAGVGRWLGGTPPDEGAAVAVAIAVALREKARR